MFLCMHTEDKGADEGMETQLACRTGKSNLRVVRDIEKEHRRWDVIVLLLLVFIYGPSSLFFSRLKSSYFSNYICLYLTHCCPDLPSQCVHLHSGPTFFLQGSAILLISFIDDELITPLLFLSSSKVCISFLINQLPLLITLHFLPRNACYLKLTEKLILLLASCLYPQQISTHW